MTDYFAILGVPTTATLAEARQAYVLRAQLLHPDRHREASPAVRAEAERAMAALNEAWAAISTGTQSADIPADAPASDGHASPFWDSPNPDDAFFASVAAAFRETLTEALAAAADLQTRAGAPSGVVASAARLLSDEAADSSELAVDRLENLISVPSQIDVFVAESLTIAIQALPAKLEAGGVNAVGSKSPFTALTWYAQRHLMQTMTEHEKNLLTTWHVAGKWGPMALSGETPPPAWWTLLPYADASGGPSPASASAPPPRAAQSRTAPPERASAPCRYCGGPNAVSGAVHTVTGMLIVWRWGSVEGPFCVDCVESIYGEAQSRTALLGWWSIVSVFFTPLVLIANSVTLGRARRARAKGLRSYS